MKIAGANFRIVIASFLVTEFLVNYWHFYQRLKDYGLNSVDEWGDKMSTLKTQIYLSAQQVDSKLFFFLLFVILINTKCVLGQPFLQ